MSVEEIPNLVVGTIGGTGPGGGWRIGADDAAAGQLVAFHPTGGGAKGLSLTDDQTPGVGTGNGGAVGVLTNSAVRRLTPIECERLMSWPDGWTAPPGVKAPDSRRYAACGDGVVANVAEWIGRGILARRTVAAADPTPEGTTT